MSATVTGGIAYADFGMLENSRRVYKYVLSNSYGTALSIITYGACMQSLLLPDKKGTLEEIILGFNNLEGYLSSHPYFGVTVGRVANRIAGSRFTLDGTEYTIEANEGNNHLHGGSTGFHRALWNVEIAEGGSSPRIVLSHASPHLEGGYPGNIKAEVEYKLTDKNELKIEYSCITDMPTPISMTNHTYWNLSGEQNVSTGGHTLEICADTYLPVNNKLIPTGEIKSVENTPMDCRPPRKVSEILKATGGLDHCFVISKTKQPYKYATLYANYLEKSDINKAAVLSHPATGRELYLHTDSPGLQVYTGNMLNNLPGRGGMLYPKHSGICLEPEEFPNAVNMSQFPSCIITPEFPYRRKSIYQFPG